MRKKAFCFLIYLNEYLIITLVTYAEIRCNSSVFTCRILHMKVLNKLPIIR